MTEQVEKEQERDLIELVSHLLLRQISAFIIILGRRGSGKTDFALFICEVAYKLLGFKYIATNTKIFDSPFTITKITDLDTLKKWAKENPGKKLFIFDEVAKSMNRRRPMAALTVDLLNEFQTIRKHKLSIVATTISENNTDNAILDPSLIDGYFEKTVWSNPKIAQYHDYLEPVSTSIDDIPKTEISYDTWDSSPFTRHGDQSKPKFKSEDEEKLWALTHGKTAKELGLHWMEVSRLWRKYIKEILETKHHASQ